MADVKLENVYKVYDGGVTAVNNFSLNIKDKEFIVFVGPSGCGKSTTLRMVAGLEKITAGKIIIEDTIINDMEPRDRDIAMVFQNYALYPHMTVFDNMAFSLKLRKFPKPYIKNGEVVLTYDKETLKEHNEHLVILRKNLAEYQKENKTAEAELVQKEIEEFEKLVEQDKIDLDNSMEEYNKYIFYRTQFDELMKLAKKDDSQELQVEINQAKEKMKEFSTTLVPVLKMRHYTKKEIADKVHEVAAILEIEDLLQRKPKALSGGQRQRVAIGRAIVRNPKVFLMDEPLSNLDAKLRNQMRAELILLRKKINTTFIYVTHDQTEAMTLGDRIVIMKDGVIQQIGTPQELFYHPSNLFVGGFIGAPQMNFIDGKLLEDYTLDIVENIITLSDEKVEELKKYDIKPQEVIIGVRPEHITLCKKNSKNALEGVVKVVELMGSSLHVHVNTLFSDNLVIVVPTVNLSEEEIAKISVGNKIYFTWYSHLCNLFSKETKENVIPFINNDDNYRKEEEKVLVGE